MAILKPFKAWHPTPDVVQKVSSVPYDVISTAEAKELAKNNPDSFLHVIRPEIDVPKETDIYDQLVYNKGKEHLDRLLSSGQFVQEKEEALYIYRITWNTHSQTGIFSCVNTKEYDHGIIVKHELTRPDKEDDRTKHILTQQAHAEPVMLTFECTDDIEALIEKETSTKPIYDFRVNEMQHTIWKVINAESFILAFSEIPKIYIADGHHRCASASRAAQEMASQNPDHSGREEYNFFPAVLFPKREVHILAYNRIVYTVDSNFIELLSNSFSITSDNHPVPKEKGTVSLYYQGIWYGLTLPESTKTDESSKLDVARLQEFIFKPFLNITDQRTDKNVYFVGGIRGTKELERLVNTGEVDLAISLFPTSIDELIAVSNAGLLMPPKSTWFEPKLRSGLLIHTF